MIVLFLILIPTIIIIVKLRNDRFKYDQTASGFYIKDPADYNSDSAQNLIFLEYNLQMSNDDYKNNIL